MSFTGATVPLPVGAAGLHGSRNPSKLNLEHLTSCEGIDFDGTSLVREGGASKLNTVALGGTLLDANTKLLLHMDGANLGTVFTDSSLTPKTFTAAGDARTSTATFKFGTASGLFDGTGDWISTPDHADFTLGAGNFTIECWFNCTVAGGTAQGIAGHMSATGLDAQRAWYLHRAASNVIGFSAWVGGVEAVTFGGTTQFTSTVNPGWHHVAVTRSGNVYRLFINGVQEATQTFAGTVQDSPHTLHIGSLGDGTYNPLWIGNLDEFRLSTGVARWTANFTPNTLPYSNLTTVPKVLAGINWSPTISNNDDVAFLSNGVVVKDTGALTFGTSLTAGLAVADDPPPWFVVAGGEASGQSPKLFLFSNAHQVQVAIGTANTMAAISTPPADWASNFPTVGCQHVNRLWGAGNSNQPHRLYYSTTGDHQNFTGAGSGTIAVFPGEGSLISAVMSFKGILIVWKYPQGIYAVDTRPVSVTDWTVQRVTSAIGGVNQQTVLQIENDILFLDASGNIHRMSTTQDIGDVLASSISEASEIGTYIRANVSFVNLRRSIGAWYGIKRKAYFMLPPASSTTPSIRLLVDMTYGLDRPRFLTTLRDTGTSLWLRPDSSRVRRPILGDAIGFAWQLDRDQRNKDNADYTVEFETSETDFAFADPQIAGHVKQNAYLEITADVIQTVTLQVTPIWDNVEHTPVVFTLGAAGAGLDALTLDVSGLAASGNVIERKQILGSGRRFRFKLKHTTGANVDMRLADFRLDFTIADERARK